jgi:hypothetical protein
MREEQPAGRSLPGGPGSSRHASPASRRNNRARLGVALRAAAGSPVRGRGRGLGARSLALPGPCSGCGLRRARIGCQTAKAEVGRGARGAGGPAACSSRGQVGERRNDGDARARGPRSASPRQPNRRFLRGAGRCRGPGLGAPGRALTKVVNRRLGIRAGRDGRGAFIPARAGCSRCSRAVAGARGARWRRSRMHRRQFEELPVRCRRAAPAPTLSCLQGPRDPSPPATAPARAHQPDPCPAAELRLADRPGCCCAQCLQGVARVGSCCAGGGFAASLLHPACGAG